MLESSGRGGGWVGRGGEGVRRSWAGERAAP